MGLSLDRSVCFPQLPELADFARAVPDLPIILNHIGGLLPHRPVRQPRRRGDAGLAQRHRGGGGCPNVYVKLGGIGMPRIGFDWHLRDKPIGSEELAAGDGAAA